MSYTEEEVARLQAAEAKLVLKGLQAVLEEIKRQRSAPLRAGVHPRYRERQLGELNGLNIAIAAIHRRLR